MAAGTQGTAPEWRLALGPRAGHHNAWNSISLLVPPLPCLLDG